MKPIKTILVPASIVKADCDKQFTVHELNAVEYIQCIDTASQYCRRIYGDSWDGNIPDAVLRVAIVAASVTDSDGQSLPIDMPAKLYELFASVSLPVNTLSKAEYESLFLDSKATRKQKQI